MVGGPAIYLLCLVLFRLRMAAASLEAFGGACACVAVGMTGAFASALVVGTLGSPCW